jgi:hypothetical protein
VTSKTDRSTIALAYADNLRNMLSALSFADDVNDDDWSNLISDIQNTYKKLGNYIETLENGF